MLWTHPPHAKLGPDLPVVRSAVVFGFYVLGQMPHRQNIADLDEPIDLSRVQQLKVADT